MACRRRRLWLGAAAVAVLGACWRLAAVCQQARSSCSLAAGDDAAFAGPRAGRRDAARLLQLERARSRSTALRAAGANAGFGSQEDRKAGKSAATLAWIEERTQTREAVEIGKTLFLAPRAKRKTRAEEAKNRTRELLFAAESSGRAALDEASVDGIFLSIYSLGAESGAWLGADAWPMAFMSKASVPGLNSSNVLGALLAGMEPSVVSWEETLAVLDMFVAATWGDKSRHEDAAELGYDGVVISTPPQQACMQYCIGTLWGFALRGLVKRLALDRGLGTVPELLSTQKQRLERALALDLQDGPGSKIDAARPTLSQYATEFFSHADWAALCKPTDAAIAVLEAELQEAMQAMVMLSTGSEDDDFELMMAPDEDLEFEFEEDMVMLDQEDWEAFQRRAVAFGSLLADAEALVDEEVGPLPRGDKPWVQSLVATDALSGMRPEQGRMAANGLLSPIQRLTSVLRDRVLPAKLRTAREGLAKLLSEGTAAAGARVAKAAKEAGNSAESPPSSAAEDESSGMV